MKKLFAIITLLASSTCLAQDVKVSFNDGVIAYALGQYEKALQIMLPLAETSGHGIAQYYLGTMYAKGQGVTQDHNSAAQWYRRSAEGGVPQAQYQLAKLYEDGKGAPKDLEQAYAWYQVAAKLGHKGATDASQKTYPKLSPAEQKAADQLAAQFIGAYGQVQSQDKQTRQGHTLH